METANPDNTFIVIVKLRIGANAFSFHEANRIGQIILEEAMMLDLSRRGIALYQITGGGVLNRANFTFTISPDDTFAAVRSLHRTLASVGLFQHASIWYQSPEGYWKLYHRADGSEDDDLFDLATLISEIKNDGEMDRAEIGRLYNDRREQFLKALAAADLPPADPPAA
jgi:hypothetical protein